MRTPVTAFALPNSRKSTRVMNFPAFLFAGFLWNPPEVEKGLCIWAGDKTHSNLSNLAENQIVSEEFLTLQRLDLRPSEIKRENAIGGLDLRNTGGSGHESGHGIGGCCDVRRIMAESYSVFGHLDRTVDHICSIVHRLLISQIGAAWIFSTCSIVSNDQRIAYFGEIALLVR